MARTRARRTDAPASAQIGRGQGGQLDHRSRQVLQRLLESQAERALKRRQQSGSRDKGVSEHKPYKQPSIEVTIFAKQTGGRLVGTLQMCVCREGKVHFTSVYYIREDQIADRHTLRVLDIRKARVCP